MALHAILCWLLIYYVAVVISDCNTGILNPGILVVCTNPESWDW